MAHTVRKLTSLTAQPGGGDLAALLAKGSLGQALGANPSAPNSATALGPAQLALRVAQFVFGVGGWHTSWHPGALLPIPHVCSCNRPCDCPCCSYMHQSSATTPAALVCTNELQVVLLGLAAKIVELTQSLGGPEVVDQFSLAVSTGGERVGKVMSEPCAECLQASNMAHLSCGLEKP